MALIALAQKRTKRCCVNRSNIRDAYNTYTGKLSDIVRQLAFAGIGVVWILRVGTESGGIAFAPQLRNVLLFYVFTLTADVLHYIVGSATWGVYNTIKEWQDTPEEEEFHAPRIINWIPLTFFWGKVLLCAYATYKLLMYLAVKI